MPEIDQCVADVKLADDYDSSPPVGAPGLRRSACCSSMDVKLEEDSSNRLKKRRGRPPGTLGKASSKTREDEDVCFVCFDGGSLVLCDRRGCPKVYHPACVKRTEAFFKSRSKWNCGWHICTACQKDSFYMCYTCPYSVCKRCVRSSEYVLLRENKGLCGMCMKTIMLIENAPEANKEKVQVDFDDQGSWEYLFKIYWVSLKEKLSLSFDDLTNAKNPWKPSKRRSTSHLHDKGDGNSPGVMKLSRAKLREMEAVPASKLDSNSCLGDRLPPLTSAAAWATDASAGGVTETMSFQVDDRLNASEQHQEGESQRASSSVVKSETRVALYGKPIDELDLNMVWLYGDPDGKIHGPFSLMNLRQWNWSGHFPPELRIWRLGEEQKSSVLLTDALNGKFHKVTATIANDQYMSVAVVDKLESRVLDFSPNSVSTDQSVISSSNSVITRSSDLSNRSRNSFSTPSNEREAVGSVSLWNKSNVESPLPGQSPISCSLSLSTFPGNSNSNCSLPQQERWNVGHTEADGNTVEVEKACNSGAGEKQATGNVQSCGQNWNVATPSSAASNAWDSNSGLVSFTDNQEIDFLDLFKFNFVSNTTTDWQPIVAGPDECDESVSDLLAEVEAMESQKRLPSPTSTYRGPGESTRQHFNEGHSPGLDVSKGDSMSSTNDLQMHLRTNDGVEF